LTASASTIKIALRIKMMAEKDFPSKVIVVSDYEETEESRRASSSLVVILVPEGWDGVIATRRTSRKSPRPPKYN
jgi:hypothetical protein